MTGDCRIGRVELQLATNGTLMFFGSSFSVVFVNVVTQGVEMVAFSHKSLNVLRSSDYDWKHLLEKCSE